MIGSLMEKRLLVTSHKNRKRKGSKVRHLNNIVFFPFKNWLK